MFARSPNHPIPRDAPRDTLWGALVLALATVSTGCRDGRATDPRPLLVNDDPGHTHGTNIAPRGAGSVAIGDDQAVRLRGSTAPVIDQQPGSSAAARVMDVLRRIDARIRITAYSHSTHVDESDGTYVFDCSAMAAWVLARSAPRALRAINRPRPVARDFFQVIHHASTGTSTRAPWMRVARVSEALPGDVLAWVRPPWFPSRNTGHVAIVLGVEQTVPGGVLVRIADASSYNHENDTRAGTTGFGYGTLLVTTDDATGEGTGYGWMGRYSGEYVVPTPVVIGRPLR